GRAVDADLERLLDGEQIALGPAAGQPHDLDTRRAVRRRRARRITDRHRRSVALPRALATRGSPPPPHRGDATSPARTLSGRGALVGDASVPRVRRWDQAVRYSAISCSYALR